MERRQPRHLLWIGVLLVVLGLLLLGARGAVAGGTDDEGAGLPAASLSADQQDWGTIVSRLPFPGPDVWQPGEERVVTFYVRNDGAEEADVPVELVRVVVQEVGDRLLGDGLVSQSARVGDGAWSAVSLSHGEQLVHVDGVPAGAVVPVSLRTVVAQGAPGPVTIPATDIALGVRLVERAPVPPAQPAGPTRDSANLVLAPAFVLAAGIACGLLVWRARRRAGLG